MSEVSELQAQLRDAVAQRHELQRIHSELQAEMYRLAGEAGLGPFLALDPDGNVRGRG